MPAAASALKPLKHFQRVIKKKLTTDHKAFRKGQPKEKNSTFSQLFGGTLFFLLSNLECHFIYFFKALNVNFQLS